ncbi:prephenate dehydratase [Cutibacterium acnes]|uniref:prephenate dehydratase n=1 Tax=Cutibacterium acnes TaxID=1747 RepID=UPI0021B722DE|nr:prephenate dehydratase [Cutibacterium acnes]
MSRIAFRPTKDRLGGYCFSIDAIGHVEDERIADALKGLYRSSRMMIFLRFYQKCLHNGFYLARRT